MSLQVKIKAAPVEFKAVTKKFGDVVAVNNVSFFVEAGSLVTLLGPSGCGKTTNLRMLAGLETPTSGKIFIGSKDVTHLSPAQRDVTMVFQSYALFPHMNVIENVSYGLLASSVPKKDAYDRARKWLQVVGLDGYEIRLPSELSGGQQQRIAVARALVLEPQVLLFDEPLSNLDSKLRRKMRQDIRELQQKLGITTVYVTHDQSEALAISDKIIVMEKAVIAQEGTPRELYENPASLFVANFVGEANVVAGTVLRKNDREVVVKVHEFEFVLIHSGVSDGLVQIAIRPEAILLYAQRPDDQPSVKAEILKSSYLGSHMEYTIRSPLGELFVGDPHVTRSFKPQQHVYIALAKHGLALVHPDTSSHRKETSWKEKVI